MSRFDPEVTLAEVRLFLRRLGELALTGEDAFLSSWRDQEAAQMLIVKLAEAVDRLPEPVLRRWPAVPWREIRGMRNRLVHAYHASDPRVLWSTVSIDAPALLELLGG